MYCICSVSFSGERLLFGLRDAGGENIYKWINNASLTYDAWRDLEPNGRTGERCVHMNRDNAYWNDISCEESNLALCSTTGED